ncbi:hypothetical protein JRI60_42610 [Archangium violaceum]|uniref:hypothetical protein n=1 Tax=Archangium violaceum TaxID=83451 RepID=UPI00194E6665|nr:hypothetical protein [Archangium violaceum]QRN95679.1 hypothetical protein JRI60_42610 [Archangium violaceum]
MNEVRRLPETSSLRSLAGAAVFALATLLSGQALGLDRVPGGLAGEPTPGESRSRLGDDTPLAIQSSAMRGAGGLKLGLGGESTDFEGQLAATLSAALVRGPFSSVATVIAQKQPGLRLEGRYALPTRTERRTLSLIATTTIFPAERTRAAIGLEARLGMFQFLADVAYENARFPAPPRR